MTDNEIAKLTLELNKFGIVIENTDKEQFFGSVGDVDLDAIVPGSALTATSYVGVSARDPGYRFLWLMGLILDPRMNLEVNLGSAVDNFALETLRLLGYEEHGYGLRSHMTLPLLMCGQRTQTEADVCLMSLNEIVLLVQETNSQDSTVDAEAQLVAKAIAAFQFNSSHRRQAKGAVTSWTYPCITMRGTCPTFYKVTITEGLCSAVQNGRTPQETTVVQRFEPIKDGFNEGMRPLAVRRRILQSFALFKTLIQYGLNPM